MGSCAASRTIVEVNFDSRSSVITFKSLMDLRMQIMKEFNLDNKFVLLFNQKIIKSSTELLYLSKSSKRLSKLTVTYSETPGLANKSQIIIGKSLAVLILNKYILFPEWLFTQSNIENHSVTIGNEEYHLKNYYLSIDVPGLALGKIRKSGRKVTTLTDIEKDLDSIDKLFVYQDSKKVQALSVTNSKNLTCSLVYNDQNLPVGILAWENKNTIVSLNSVKSSVHFATHFTSLPDESVPASMTNINFLTLSQNFTEYSACFRSNKLVTFHPSDFSVSYLPVDKNFENFSITQTPLGYIFANNCEVFKFNGSTLQSLPRPTTSHSNHSAVLHQLFFVLISGSGTASVDSLHLHNLTWSSLPNLPVTVEHPASCSSGGSLFVLGGRVKGLPADSVYRLEESKNWECLNWKLPWTATAACAFAFGKEIVVFGGVQSEKDKFVVLEDGKDIASGYIGAHASFDGMSAGKVSSSAVCFSRQGQIFKYDHNVKKFFIMSIGNYFN